MRPERQRGPSRDARSLTSVRMPFKPLPPAGQLTIAACAVGPAVLTIAQSDPQPRLRSQRDRERKEGRERKQGLSEIQPPARSRPTEAAVRTGQKLASLRILTEDQDQGGTRIEPRYAPSRSPRVMSPRGNNLLRSDRPKQLSVSQTGSTPVLSAKPVPVPYAIGAVPGPRPEGGWRRQGGFPGP